MTVTGVRMRQAAVTRAALIEAARHVFAEKGYHGAGTPELAAAAGVSRGALYHHFGDKEALFEAVFSEVESDLRDAASASVRHLGHDPWRQLNEGVEAFLRIIAASPEIQRILLREGPAVLGWTRWRELGTEFTLGHLMETLERLTASGVLRPQPLKPLGHLAIAALNEAALLIAHSGQPTRTRDEATEALRAMLAGLRMPHAG